MQTHHFRSASRCEVTSCFPILTTRRVPLCPPLRCRPRRFGLFQMTQAAPKAKDGEPGRIGGRWQLCGHQHRGERTSQATSSGRVAPVVVATVERERRDRLARAARVERGANVLSTRTRREAAFVDGRARHASDITGDGGIDYAGQHYEAEKGTLSSSDAGATTTAKPAPDHWHDVNAAGGHYPGVPGLERGLRSGATR
jgi:hypothetical protein